MTREDKLRKLKDGKAAKGFVVASVGEPFIEAIETKITELGKTLDKGTELTNVDELLVALEQVNILKDAVSELRTAIKAVPAIPDTIDINGLDSLVKATQIISKQKINIEKVDPKPFLDVSKKMDVLIKAIQENKVKEQTQKPEDYIPTRRVVKVDGVGLMYDDSFYTGGGGGGSGIAQYVDANGVTQNVGPSYPLPTTATINTGDIEIGAVELKDGTNDTRSTVLAGDTDQNPILIAPARKEVSFTTTTVQAVGTTDVSNYRWVSVQIVTQGGSSTVTFQGSNDNSNWVSIALSISTNVGTTAPVVSTTAASSYSGPLSYRYFRLNVTGIVSGTTAGVIELFTTPSTMLQPAASTAITQLALADNADGVIASATANGVKTLSSIRLFDGTNFNRWQQSQNATNSVGTGIAAVGNLAQFDDVSPTAITENSFGNLRISANRNLYNTIRDAAGNERGLNISANNAAGVAGDIASAATDSGNPIKTGAKYNTTAPTVTDGQRVDSQADSRGNLKTVDGAYEIGTLFNAVLNDVDISVKGSAGYLKSIRVSNINAAIRYLQIHNKATAPAGGDTPILSFPIPAGSATVPQYLSFGQDDWGPGGLSCSTGISIGISTVAATFTAATTTDHVTAGSYV